MMFKNLIFDWSGTLVDDLGPVLDATNAVFAAYGLKAMTRAEFQRVFRLPYAGFYEEYLPGVPIADLEVLFRSAFAASRSPVVVLPHAREKLDWCRKRGIRSFVLTSMDAAAFGRQLKRFKLGGAFEATYAGVVDKRELIGEILDLHALEPNQTAFVGDMVHDIETARHGGVASVAVLTGYTAPETLAEARPDFTVANLAELREMIEVGVPRETEQTDGEGE
jgi:phosphoglycolate phosphatase